MRHQKKLAYEKVLFEIGLKKSLITSSGTRGIVHREFESTGEIPNSAVDILEKKYIIRKEERAGAQWYELTHDRLIKPINNSNKKWQYQRMKSKRSSQIKVIIPVAVSIIIVASLFVFHIFDQLVFAATAITKAAGITKAAATAITKAAGITKAAATAITKAAGITKAGSNSNYKIKSSR